LIYGVGKSFTGFLVPKCVPCKANLSQIFKCKASTTEDVIFQIIIKYLYRLNNLYMTIYLTSSLFSKNIQGGHLLQHS